MVIPSLVNQDAYTVADRGVMEELDTFENV